MDKVKEKLLHETYVRFVQTGSNVIPPNEIDTFVDADIMGYGTTLDEKILSATGFLELIERQKEQGKDVEMKFDIAPVLRRVLADENAAVFVDEITVSMLINNQTHKMFMRFTSVLEYRDNKWLVVHWHGSKPEYEEGREDTWHIDEHKAKTERLEKEVAEKTADLLEKNRELEMEAALERVRAVALSMNKPADMLEVCRVISNQLTQFNVKDIRNVQTVIITESKGTYLNYQYFTAYDRLVTEETDPAKHPTVLEMVHTMQKSADSFFGGSLEGEKLEEFRKYREKENQFPDPLLDKTKAAYYYFYSIGQGGLGVTTYKPLPEEGLNIFKRFHNVFALAYRRFLDIQKAEAQVREAQIEAALERVRSKAMSMQKSDDLSMAVKTIFYELDKLDLSMLRCGIGILNKEKRTADVWTTTVSKGKNTIQVSGDESMDIHPVLQGAFEAWLNQTDFSYVLEGDDLNRYYKALLGVNFKLPKSQSKVSNTEGLKQFYYVTSFQAGGLFAFRETEFPEESKIVMKRFADVFNLTYTRFQDLQHAEAQAREAQIEVALERVRSRTMAMHESSELAETAAVVFRQLINLGIEPNRIYIAIIKDEKGTVEFWITDEDGSKVSSGFTANLNENISFKKMLDGWKEQKKSITIDMHGKELQEYFRHLNSLNVPFKGGQLQKRRVQNIAYFSQGFIGVASPDPQPQETTDLLKRFAAVYNLTYTRFNDLKQAEAQNKIIKAENERKSKELEEARHLQLSMLPRELPQLPNFDIAVYMQTATEVGGDYYDFHTGEDGTLTAVIGDATGHGMKAGTVVTITKSLFNNLAEEKNITDTFQKISRVIKDMKFRQLSMCLMMIKIKKGKLLISSAAMPPALIYRKKTGLIEEIFLRGMPLGAINNFPYVQKENMLEKGDTLLMLSDGLPELMNAKTEMYGYDRIKSELLAVGDKTPQQIINHLKNSAEQWANGKVPDDDVTFVVIKVKK